MFGLVAVWCPHLNTNCWCWGGVFGWPARWSRPSPLARGHRHVVRHALLAPSAPQRRLHAGQQHFDRSCNPEEMVPEVCTNSGRHHLDGVGGCGQLQARRRWLRTAAGLHCMAPSPRLGRCLCTATGLSPVADYSCRLAVQDSGQLPARRQSVAECSCRVALHGAQPATRSVSVYSYRPVASG